MPTAVMSSSVMPRSALTWSKQSNEGRGYLSRKLNDPSFTVPIFANLFDDLDGESYTLIWSCDLSSTAD